MDKLKIKIIMGSTRPDRFSEHPARWIAGLAEAKREFDVELLDLRDYPMPFYDEPVSPTYRKGPPHDDMAKQWAEKIKEADGFIVVSPEYNHGYPAVLKNAFDQVYFEWNQKPVAFVSYGSTGGARAVEQLRGMAVELQMAPVRNAVHIFAPWDLVADGALKAGALDPYAHSAESMLVQLLWWTRALKTARG
ncbi:MAG: NAD(P)H-dependent oxidoreductase [bacterium]|nr:NAD(P)H-dependent oxidoreductase [bacterium]